MKKLALRGLFLALAMSVAVLPAAAQFKFGVKAGVNINKLHLKNLGSNYDSNNRAGFTAGLMTEFTIPVIGLSFDASLMFTRLYTDVNYGPAVAGVQNAATMNQSFFEVPINLKYKFQLPAVSKIIAPYIFTGPSFAFRVSGNDNWFKTRTFQPTWNVGAGLELIRHLQIGAGYSFGINNIYRHVSDNSVNNIKARNNYWTVTAAYLF